MPKVYQPNGLLDLSQQVPITPKPSNAEPIPLPFGKLLCLMTNRVISTAMIYRGALNSASMRVCEVFREAIRQNACTMIVSHNHPSSDPTPSANDIYVTKELVKAGKILDLEVVDHLVIGGTNSFVSLKERGLGFE